MSSILICSLSNSLMIDPVVSTKTGHLYEKSTILKHIQSFHTCPHTDQQLQQKDLIPVIGKIQQNLVTASIPGVLQKMQKQYDNAILQAYYLKKTLNEKRQQLASSLYRQQAAIRVIAKLKKERDQLRQQLTQSLSKIEN